MDRVCGDDKRQLRIACVWLVVAERLIDVIPVSMICDFFHPAVGGVEKHIYMLSVNLMKQGHKV